jgi:uncharacterized cupin superfamily protein
MPKPPAPAALDFLHVRQPDHPAGGRLRGAGRARQPIHDGHAPKPAGAAGDTAHPGIFRIPLDRALTERAVYPPGIAVGSFDGAYAMATMYKSGVFAGNKVAFWGSEAGALKAGSYPLDEFVYVLEGDLVTVDADGTRHEFHPGDALVIPKGWAGTWDMKTRFKKIIVNF